ncbi:hypothetical protein CC85DRAFT_306012 [Cutaneotrichosporon oleaginosum]|uniref:RNase III domain-containing protein n=1 Tax=Cutaneotrichosporon oleaginosum TaxID=879819 RepID=A0A0J0XBF0_9TREE|nr:uncharacterized protein CC85DRAFT_306012 [Cutaneotrichosporon oleaginosum]KLT38388.1 hypothetical protein CC85DRAFT_306012 [Cutaneotrichosporon oleaginosum]TXT12557.1 hypothetical protein COLE_02967 [Cutaneotrichosporon oleaginosum]
MNTRAARNLPNGWKRPAHPPRIPASYPALLPLLHLSPVALNTALRAPILFRHVSRGRNPHRQAAQLGDAYLRVLLLELGAEMNLPVVACNHLVSLVGANTTLAQITLESGVLDVALQRSSYSYATVNAAAGIFEALIAVMHEEIGARATGILRKVLMPWIAAVIDAKVVPAVRQHEGREAANAISTQMQRMLRESLLP